VSATVSSWNATSIVAAVPSQLTGTVNVVVTVGGTASTPVTFTVTPPTTSKEYIYFGGRVIAIENQ
jgi:hypothetical protein